MSVEGDNAKGVVQELISGGVKSGLSKSRCPVYRVLREETFSPRGQILNLEKGFYSADLIFKNALCKSADISSLTKIDYSKIIREARRVLVEEGKEPEVCKEVLEELKSFLLENSK